MSDLSGIQTYVGTTYGDKNVVHKLPLPVGPRVQSPALPPDPGERGLAKGRGPGRALPPLPTFHTRTRPSTNTPLLPLHRYGTSTCSNLSLPPPHLPSPRPNYASALRGDALSNITGEESDNNTVWELVKMDVIRGTVDHVWYLLPLPLPLMTGGGSWCQAETGPCWGRGLGGVMDRKGGGTNRKNLKYCTTEHSTWTSTGQIH